MSDWVSRNASSPVDAADRNQGSRREFIGAGAFALLAATGSAVVASAEDKPAARTSEGPWTAASSYDVGFRRRAVELRQNLAREVANTPIPPHPHKGDQQRYANAIGSDTRGLPHDERGEVSAEAWRLANVAFATRAPSNFEKIQLGGTRKLVNPVGTLAVSLDGLNASQFQLPAAAAFQGPKVNGRVTPQTLLRGSVAHVDPADPSSATAVSGAGAHDRRGIEQARVELFRRSDLGRHSLALRCSSILSPR